MYFLCFSCGLPPQVFHDCWPLWNASFLLIDPKNEEKTTIVILMSLCTRDKRPFQQMWMDTFTISVQILVGNVVSRYPLFWLPLNLNLCRHAVGKSEWLLIPLPRASLDPLSWYFCMSALSTGGSCMAVYEYLLMLRLTWLIAQVCCHDNALRCAGCSLFFQHSNASHFFLECLFLSKYVFESEGEKCWGKHVKLCHQKNFVPPLTGFKYFKKSIWLVGP